MNRVAANAKITLTNAERNLYNKVNNHKKNLHSCNQCKGIANLFKCNECFDPYANEEECLFKEFRAFYVKKKGFKFGYYFPDAVQQIFSLSQSNFEEYCHVCNICLTSIFNFHYVCSGCAINVCIHCYNNWRQLKDDPKKTTCHNGLKHAPQMFTLSQKHTSEDMDTIMMELDEEDVLLGGSGADAEAVLNEKLEIKNINSVVLPVNPDSDDQHFDYVEDRGSSSNALLQERSSGGVRAYDDDSTHSVSVDGHGIGANYEAVSHKDEGVTNSNEKKRNCLEDAIMTEETSMSLPTMIVNGVTLTTRKFQEIWQKKDPLLVENYLERSSHRGILSFLDWHPKDDFEEIFNELYDDNISNRLLEEYMSPDLGPKMFISQVNDPAIKGRTKLYCNMADAVNLICYSKTELAAGVWDIFASKDFPGLREMDLIELEKQTGIKPFRFNKKAGDAVFIPIGCVHQVQNVAGSIKCDYDFLSPERMNKSNMVTNHFQNIKLEDKLQLRTTLLYAWKPL
ncbi:hypothetical protein K501DRAFT_268446 [Backusella circina FSU 941]|nr:hypothetical protein K501DRAFT_268446 [Backusella circina FSU 941]